MSTWPVAPIASLCERVTSGGTPSRSDPANYTTVGGHAWVKSAELKDTRIWSTEENISDKGLSSSSAKYLPAGTVLVAMYGANVGQLGILGVPATLNQAICGLVVDPGKANARFVFYSLMHRRQALISQAKGAAQQNLSAALIKGFKLSTPTLQVQHRIASILGSYDDLIEVNQGRIARLDELSRGLFEEWFVRFRFPGYESCVFHETPAGRVPANWGVMKIGDVCSLMQAGGTPSRGNPTYWADPEIDWYTTGELSDCFLLSSKEKVSSIAVSERKARLFSPPTIFMAIYGATIGKLGIAMETCSANQAALGMKPDSKYVDFWFLYQTLLNMRPKFISIGQGAAQQNISKEKVRDSRVMLPPRELIARFENAASAWWMLRFNLERQQSSLVAARNLLLPRLISGDLPVAAAARELETAA